MWSHHIGCLAAASAPAVQAWPLWCRLSELGPWQHQLQLQSESKSYFITLWLFWCFTIFIFKNYYAVITEMQILCGLWLPEVWNPWTSPNAEFPHRTVMQQSLDAACLWACLPSVLSSLHNSIYLKKLLGCFHSIFETLLIWIILFPISKHMTESEQNV